MNKERVEQTLHPFLIPVAGFSKKANTHYIHKKDIQSSIFYHPYIKKII